MDTACYYTVCFPPDGHIAGRPQENSAPSKRHERRERTVLDTAGPHNIAEMPAQRPAVPATPEQARGRLFNTGNAFNVKLPPVPDHMFTAEPQQALDPATPTGLIACDLQQELACDFPATSPFVLARYARIRAGERLETDFA